MGDREGRMLSGAEAIVACLEAENTQGIFGYPGGQALDIFDALYNSPQLHCTLVRHEQGAVHAADGYARATGNPGVVVVTSGPGATNTVTGIANAYMDSIPLIVISGQVDTFVIGTDAFQESDITGITLPITKHSYLVKDVCELPRIMKEAFYVATTGRPGPVLIDVPSNIAKERFEFHYPARNIQMATYRPTYKGNNKQVKQAAAYIQEARRPILYAGGGVVSSGATSELKMLAELMQIPVVTTLMGKGCFSEDHYLSLGMSGMHGSEFANKAIMESGLVIAVGVRFADRVTGKLADFAKGAKIIHIDIDPAEIGKNIEPDVPIVGDAKGVLAGITAELQKSEAVPKSDEWIERVSAWRTELALPRPKSDTDILPNDLIDTLCSLTENRDVIITTEVGQHQMWAAQYLPVLHPRTFLSSGGLGAMGFGFPAALGAQIAFPEKLVICLAGDGSIQMNVQEMATAAINKLPVKVIIFNNSCLGMVRQWQQFFYHERYSASLLSENPDFVKLAEAYSWAGKRIDAPQELRSALIWLIDSPGPALLDVRIPRGELVLPMVVPTGALDDMLVDITASESIEGREE